MITYKTEINIGWQLVECVSYSLVYCMCILYCMYVCGNVEQFPLPISSSDVLQMECKPEGNFIWQPKSIETDLIHSRCVSSIGKCVCVVAAAFHIPTTIAYISSISPFVSLQHHIKKGEKKKNFPLKLRRKKKKSPKTNLVCFRLCVGLRQINTSQISVANPIIIQQTHSISLCIKTKGRTICMKMQNKNWRKIYTNKSMLSQTHTLPVSMRSFFPFLSLISHVMVW